MYSVGFHAPKNEYETARRRVADELPQVVPAVQLFLRQGNRRLYSDEELDQIRAWRRTHSVRFLAHGAYTDAGIWNRYPNSIDTVRGELSDADRCECEGVVVHLAKGAKNEEMREHALGSVTDTTGTARIILEINATKPGYYSFEAPHTLNELFDSIGEMSLNRNVALCIDTAHLFGCGVSFAHEDEVINWFEKLDVKNPLYMHLNDNLGGFATGGDIHEVLGRGKIWDNHDSGLRRFAQIAGEYGAPMILERNTAKLDGDFRKLRQDIIPHM